MGGGHGDHVPLMVMAMVWPRNGDAAVALCTGQGRVQTPNRKSSSSAHAHGSNACADGGVLHGNHYGVGDDPHSGGLEGRR